MMKKRYLSQFVSEMFDSLQYKCTECAPQYVLNSFVTMATYWVPDLSPVTFHFDICWWCLIYIILQQAYKYVSSSLWPRLMFFKLKITNSLKSRGWDWKRVSYHWNSIFCNCNYCVSCRTISLPGFNDLCCKLTKYLIILHYWVECITSTGTYADICAP